MMMFSERRIAFHVAQGVVHPAHVPLQTEAQTARVGGPRNLRPGGGFLGNGLHIRVLAINRFLEAAQRIHGFQVFASAILVGNPFARFARVVQAKHGSHAIDAQPVHVILLQPKEGAAQQETADFVAAVIEEGTGPLRVEPFARVRRLIEVSAVETGQPVAVGREMRRHPIHKNADALLMQTMHQEHEVLRRTVTAGRRKVAGGLVHK